MWPYLLTILRSNAVYITLPVAAIIGIIGYNVENLVSDKYTPYSNSIQENRVERLAKEADLADPTQKMQPQNVLERNLSPSLMKKVQSNGEK